jgi:predicted RND superfamily exporter protein
MAVAVIGGLITSTVLSLLVVPAVFTYMDDLEHFIKRMAGKLSGKAVEAVEVRAGDVRP